MYEQCQGAIIHGEMIAKIDGPVDAEVGGKNSFLIASFMSTLSVHKRSPPHLPHSHGEFDQQRRRNTIVYFQSPIAGQRSSFEPCPLSGVYGVKLHPPVAASSAYRRRSESEAGSEAEDQRQAPEAALHVFILL
jgi:hypothetical protein